MEVVFHNQPSPAIFGRIFLRFRKADFSHLDYRHTRVFCGLGFKVRDFDEITERVIEIGESYGQRNTFRA